MLESLLVSLVGAGGFVGAEFAKEAVKRYSQKLLNQFDAVAVDRVWDLVSQGQIEDAKREVQAAHLAPAIEAAVKELHEDTFVLHMSVQPNEFIKRAAHLEKVIDSIFAISRAWNTDLLLLGGLSDSVALTLFKTNNLPMCKFAKADWNIGFSLQGADRSMFVIPKSALAGEETSKAMLLAYRNDLTYYRTRMLSNYFPLSYNWLENTSSCITRRCLQAARICCTERIQHLT